MDGGSNEKKMAVVQREDLQHDIHEGAGSGTALQQTMMLSPQMREIQPVGDRQLCRH
jgi:hypothetical protein